MDKRSLSHGFIDNFMVPQLIITTEDGSVIPMFTVDNSDTVSIPLGFYDEAILKGKNLLRLDENRSYPNSRFSLDPELRDNQISMLVEIEDQLSNRSAIYVKAATGYGKTRIGICIAHILGVKTAVLMHSTTLIDSWINEIQSISTAKVYVVPVGGIPDLPDGYDIYIIMVRRCRHLSDTSLIKIGLLIVEEAKYLCTRIGIEQMLRFYPARLIGLCAEDNKDNAFDLAINAIFGKIRIERQPTKPLTVIEVISPFTPIKYYQDKGKFKGRLDWTSMATDFYENNKGRNDALADLIKDLSADHRIMALSLRKIQASYIYNRLIEMGVDAALYIGAISIVENAKVIVATAQKGSIGFDASNKIIGYDGIPINCVVFLCSFKKKLQGTGRADRSESPIVVEIIDDDNTIRNHYNETRKLVYKPRGAEFIRYHL